jgi:hypothetical protein
MCDGARDPARQQPPVHAVWSLDAAKFFPDIHVTLASEVTQTRRSGHCIRDIPVV